MMINDHTNTTQQLTAAAQAAGMSPPPPKLTPKQAGMIDKLRGASASAFDSTYLTQQTGAHDKALKLHQNYASNGDTPALKSVASKASTTVQQHIAELKKLSAK